MVSNTAGLLKTVLELSRSSLQKQNSALLPTIPASPDHLHSRRSPLKTSLHPFAASDGSRRRSGRRNEQTKTANASEKVKRDAGNGRSTVFASHRLSSGTSSDEESDSKAESDHSHRVTIENDEKGNHVTPWKRVISFWKNDQTGGGSQGSKVEEPGIGGGNAMTFTKTLADEDFKVTMTKTETLDTLLSPDIPNDTLKDDTETPDESSSCFVIPVEHLPKIQPIVKFDPSYPEPHSSGSVQLTAALGQGRWYRDVPPNSCRLPATRGRNVTLPKTKRRRPSEIFRKISLSPSTAFLRRNDKTAAPRSVSAGSLYFENAVFSSLDSEQRCPKDTSRAQTAEDISWTENVKDAPSRVSYLNKCVEMK